MRLKRTFVFAALLLTISCCLSLPPGNCQGACKIEYVDRKQVLVQSLGCYGVPVIVKSGPMTFAGTFLNAIKPGSRAHANKLQTGDVVLRINGLIVQTPKHIDGVLANMGDVILNMDYGRVQSRIFKIKRIELLQASNRANPHAAKPVNELEDLMYKLVDQDRIDNGFKGLKRSSRLGRMARSYADDMGKRNFTGHTDPEGRGVLERFKLTGMRSRGIVLENCAYPSPSKDALDMVRSGEAQLMASDGHKSNILYPEALSVGVGIAYRRDGGLMIVQVFSTDTIP